MVIVPKTAVIILRVLLLLPLPLLSLLGLQLLLLPLLLGLLRLLPLVLLMLSFGTRSLAHYRLKPPGFRVFKHQIAEPQ